VIILISSSLTAELWGEGTESTTSDRLASVIKDRVLPVSVHEM